MKMEYEPKKFTVLFSNEKFMKLHLNELFELQTPVKFCFEDEVFFCRITQLTDVPPDKIEVEYSTIIPLPTSIFGKE